MNNVVTSIVTPLFGIMLAGYLCGYFKLFQQNASVVLSRFVFLIALPTLVFVKLSHVAVAEFFNWSFLAALGGGMLAVFCIAFFVARRFFAGSLTAHSLHALTAMFSSTGYVGLPMVLLLFGDAALVPGIIGTVITGSVFMPISIVLAEIDRGRGDENIKTRYTQVAATALVAVARNPVLIATAAGLSMSALEISLAAPLTTFGELLGGAYVPCALFAAGLFISGCSIKIEAKGQTNEIAWLVFAKLVIHPVITWWLAYRVFALDGILPAIAVIQAALPSGVPVFVLAQHYGVFVFRTSAVIFVSTTLSVITLSLLLVYGLSL